MLNVKLSKKHRVSVSISPCDCQRLFITIFVEVTSLQCLLCQLYNVLCSCTCCHLSHLQFYLYKYNTLTSNKRYIKAQSFQLLLATMSQYAICLMISFLRLEGVSFYRVDPEKRIAGLMLLTAGLSPRITVYNRKSVHVGFVVDNLKLEYVVLLAFRVFPISVFNECTMSINL